MKISYKVNKKGNEYVGIYFKDNNEFQIQFPIGYRINEKEPRELKQDIKKLMKLISKKTGIEGDQTNIHSDFSIISAIKVLENYSQYGLYRLL